MPKVSVIIPTYNSEKYICKAIDSVLMQTYKDFEIIVIDDGSSDNTKDILSKYNGKIRYLYEDNKGASAARNLGIKESRGEYVAFLDADDIWLADKLKLQVDAINTDPQIALVCTDAESFNEQGIVKTTFFTTADPDRLLKRGYYIRHKIAQRKINDLYQFKGNFYKELISRNFILTSSVLMRKTCFDKIGYFNSEFHVTQDYDLWLRAAMHFPFLYINKVTFRYRLRDDSLSGKLSIREYTYLKQCGKILERHLEDCPASYKKTIKRLISEHYRIAAWGFLCHDELKKVKPLSLRSLLYDKTQIKLYLYILVSFLPLRWVKLIKKLKLRSAKRLALKPRD
jgi:hypothetical protein